MGVAVSTHTETYPFSLASGIIGLVSFGFTLGTFFKVVWVNLETMGEAPHQVHAYLTNLRTELLEEKANLKAMRKGLRKYRRSKSRIDVGFGLELDDVILKTMNDSLRDCIRQFRELEKPFLEPGELGIDEAPNHRTRTRRRNSSVSPPRYSHAAYSSPPEKTERSRVRDRSMNHEKDTVWDKEEEDEAYWAQRINYKPFNINLRFKWLTRKSGAQQLNSKLTRIQLRRVARQVGGMALLMHEYGSGTMELNEAVRRIDERVSRVVGVRRVSE